jgi:DNA polymerase-3 subunit delta'
MTAFDNFWGNEAVAISLAQMPNTLRIPQAILLSGPEGIGKATLVRRFAARLLGGEKRIEEDDLNLPANLEIVDQREKWPADKRAEDPLFFASHPDFLTLAPDGPLRQISIQQIRLLRERAQFKPLHGKNRVFLIDHLDRANEQAANSLLKLLEEPPEHLIIFATAENVYDLLPTIRSRSIVFQMTRLEESEVRQFVEAKGLADTEARILLAEGCPGLAYSLNVDLYRERRSLILTFLECAAGLKPFSFWIQASESFASRKTEKLEFYIKPMYALLEGILTEWQGGATLRNRDLKNRIAAIAARISFRWIEAAARAFDDVEMMVRRNIQKLIALDAVIIDLRNQLSPSSA